MQNEAGDFVDMYIPRKWWEKVKKLSVITKWSHSSSSGRIIAAKDHASIQINVAEVNKKTGVMTGHNKTYALCGFIRAMVMILDTLTQKYVSLL